MTFRRATDADRPAVEAHLAAHADTSMFPLSNLRSHGMSGGHPRAMRFWVAGEPVAAVLGLTEGGAVLPRMPPALAAEAARALAGERVAAVLGEAAQVAALKAALRLPGAAHDEVEALMALDAGDLVMPPTDGLTLAPLDAAPRDLLVRWRMAYNHEALGAAPDDVTQAEDDVATEIAGGEHRVLLRGAEPVAATGFNARLPDRAQVGGVWTPPGHRNHGLARAAVALHLAEARAEGVRRAVLFTANPAAARAYRALGFRDAGRFALLLLAAPVEVGDA